MVLSTTNCTSLAVATLPTRSLTLTGNSILQCPPTQQKANMPGSQPNVRGSAVALDALFAFGGGNPFLASESIATRAAGEQAPGSAKAARDSAKGARDSAKTAPVRNFDPASIKRTPLLPATTGRTDVYVPATDTWSRSANLNIAGSFPSAPLSPAATKSSVLAAIAASRNHRRRY